LSEPTFSDLEAFLDRLRRDGALAVVEAAINARLEAAEIHGG
jgi:3-polyprenyl-4-hydroxybenzoate decarboxylase